MSGGLRASKMEDWLRCQIKAATGENDANCRIAELAGYLARLGRFEECRELIAVLKKTNEVVPKVALSIRIHLAEGFVCYFESCGVGISDGVQRAYALSAASGMRDLQALSAAWLAQYAHSTIDVHGIHRYVSESFRLAAPDDHGSRARACLVVAQLLHLGDRFDLAKIWYLRAKNHAINGRDGATVGALIHSMAWHRMLVLRQAVLTNIDSMAARANVLESAASAEHFGTLVGNTAWQKLQPLLQAQIVSLLGNAAQALILYGEHLTVKNVPRRWQANLLADRAWCHAVCGEPDLCLYYVSKSIESIENDTRIDDRAATYSRLSQIFEKVQNIAEAERYQVLANESWIEFSNLLKTGIDYLSTLREDGQTGS